MISIERTKFRFCGFSGFANSCPGQAAGDAGQRGADDECQHLVARRVDPHRFGSDFVAANGQHAPERRRAMLRTMTMVRIATAKIQKKFVIGMAAVNPVAPPTAGIFR